MARCGLQALQVLYGYDRILHFEDHCRDTDPFTIPETTERALWYGVEGYPTCFFDGIGRMDGAGVCEDMIYVYDQLIQERLAGTGGLSPVAISGDLEIRDGNAVLTAAYRLVDPVPMENVRATLVLYEDGVEWCCGSDSVHTWEHVTRRIEDETVTLLHVGDETVVQRSIPIEAVWNPAELHGVAYLQDIGSKEIIQGFWMRNFSIDVDRPVRSVQDAPGEALFHGTLRNLERAEEVFTLRIDEPFGDWPAEIQVCGDPGSHTEPVEVRLAPGDSCGFHVRVRTDASHEIRRGVVRAICESSGRSVGSALRVWNGSPSILLVDEDGLHDYEMPLVRALDADGLLHDLWDVAAAHHDSIPDFPRMNGFDIVVWHTANRAGDVIPDAGRGDLIRYLESGGALFLTSQSFLNSLGGGTDPFVRDYLGVLSYSLDRGYDHLTGAAGDAIGDGLDLPLHFDYPTWRRGDDAVPGPTAATALYANDGSHSMIHNRTAGGARTVFLAERFDALGETDPDPNNTRVVLRRVIDWLAPDGTASVRGPGARPIRAFPDLFARPNPFNRATEIAFTVPPGIGGASARLEIVDIAGRSVALLARGVLDAGPRLYLWDGRDTRGRACAAGVYFARLRIGGEERFSKLILLQ